MSVKWVKTSWGYRSEVGIITREPRERLTQARKRIKTETFDYVTKGRKFSTLREAKAYAEGVSA